MPDLSPDETVRVALQISHARLRRQHELVVGFGVESLRITDLDVLLTQVCQVAVTGMGTEFAKVLRPVAGQERFVLSHGVGWDPADIGSATVAADVGSPAGYAFAKNRPVIANHLGDEQRFRTPTLLRRYGIERAINVPIRGTTSTYGVLEADGREGGAFIESDLVFLEGLANIVSLSLERLTVGAEAKSPHPYSESVVNASPDCVKILSQDGRIEFFNEAGLCRMQIDDLAAVLGKSWPDLWPDDSRPVVVDALNRVNAGDSVRFESFCPSARGEPRWWDVSAAPIFDKQGQVEKIIAVSRDITERHEQEARLAALVDSQNSKLSETDLHLEEIHHRVRNSLHLVNTLLLLQANLASEDTVKVQLRTAASRVLTIATVHDRLYQDADARGASAIDYLRTLLGDIGKAFGDRAIVLRGEAPAVSAQRMAPLGLVVSELVTNALKYGKGLITVELACEGLDAVIAVSDEGDGFPASYPKPTGSGLGMRLVRSYSGNGAQAVSVEGSTIRVRFRL